MQRLDLSRVGAQLTISSFTAVAQLRGLHALDLTGCSQLTTLSAIADLTGKSGPAVAQPWQYRIVQQLTA